MHRHSLLHIMLTAVLGLSASTALAAQNQGEQNQAGGNQQAAEITEQDIQNFADAHQQVMQVRKQYLSQARDAEGKQQKAQLQMAMQKDMLEAVRDSGMKPQRYNTVAREVGQDEELRKRVEEALEE